MSIPCVYKTHDEARKAGWFSRRHPTNAELLMARIVRASRKKPKKRNSV
jgi:hypothetical protein